MRKTDKILDEIHAIRRQIDEETKNMTSAERADYINQSAEAALKENGYKIIYLNEEKTMCRLESDTENIQAMKRHAEIEDEINEIRRRFYEKTKDNACSEQPSYFKQSEPAAKKHSL